ESFYWNMAKDSAQAALNRYPTVTSGTLYTNLQAAMQQTYSTITECATAVQTLQSATASFLSGATTDVKPITFVDQNTPVNVYNVYGQLISSKYTRAEALKSMKNGIYIIGNEKVIIQSK
ncbi:MAG TPA: hypothetical protein VFK73_10455, partial [Paludibacter sp.]|nr:hypothetical protein [Paludibacter sp.]